MIIAQRELKFRIWNPSGKNMLHDIENVYDCLKQQHAHDKTQPQRGFTIPYDHKADGMVWMQFTGQTDITGKEVYEGDIGRVTEEEEFGDHNIYLICAWIKEWSMFAWVEHNEYSNYLNKGVSALDEFMFWTYNMEDSGVTICGNIYQHPDYILKCLKEEEKTMTDTLKDDDTE